MLCTVDVGRCRNKTTWFSIEPRVAVKMRHRGGGTCWGGAPEMGLAQVDGDGAVGQQPREGLGIDLRDPCLAAIFKS